MRDNQAQHEEKKPTKTAASPSGATNSPSRKRLLTDPKPKQASTAISPDLPLPSAKKTRELPNLSDCHGCGLRINYTNPKERLQILDSVWRIVLLCKKCIKRVEFAEICPYCFAGTSESDCFRCRDCNRCIHKECVVNNGGLAPLSYCNSEFPFRVCIDCWIPNLLLNSIRAYCRKRNKKKKVVLGNCSVGDTRVSVNINGAKKLEDVSVCNTRVSVNINGAKKLEEVVNDANCVVEKKIAVATKAKETALRKAVVAKSAVEFANGALGLIAKKEENGSKSEYLVTSSSSSGTIATTAVDDAELAFQLHRAMNSSPRIARNLCSINSSCLAVSRIRDLNVANSKLNEKSDTTVLETSVCFSDSGCGSSVVLGNLNVGAMSDRKTSLNSKECQVLVGECNSSDDNKMKSESKCFQKQYKRRYKCQSSGNRTIGLLNCGGNNTVLHDERCNDKPDRYLLKYRKRRISSKAASNCETKFLYESFCLQNQASAPRLPLNC